MALLKLTGRVDEKHRLLVEVPPSVSIGPVELLVVIPDGAEDEAGANWSSAIAREWADELGNPAEDIYTLNDGEPSDGSR